MVTHLLDVTEVAPTITDEFDLDVQFTASLWVSIDITPHIVGLQYTESAIDCGGVTAMGTTAGCNGGSGSGSGSACMKKF